MEGYDASTYGERIADVYDDQPEHLALDTERTVEVLADLAGDGPVLELGIGTGRVALPLAERGIDVHGIDASPAMVERLRAKPGGDRIVVTVGDMADVAAPGDGYSFVYVVFNTFFGILTQDDQVRCFQGVASRLRPGGRFLIEAFVPDVTRFDRGQRVEVKDLSLDDVLLHVARHDPVAQRIDTANVSLGTGGIGVMPIVIRYAYPSELDLMARIAGLGREARWGGWDRSTFTAASRSHVTVYRAPV